MVAIAGAFITVLTWFGYLAGKLIITFVSTHFGWSSLIDQQDEVALSFLTGLGFWGAAVAYAWENLLKRK